MEGPTLKRKLDAYKKNETTQPKTSDLILIL